MDEETRTAEEIESHLRGTRRRIVEIVSRLSRRLHARTNAIPGWALGAGAAVLLYVFRRQLLRALSSAARLSAPVVVPLVVGKIMDRASYERDVFPRETMSYGEAALGEGPSWRDPFVLAVNEDIGHGIQRHSRLDPVWPRRGCPRRSCSRQGRDPRRMHFSPCSSESWARSWEDSSAIYWGLTPKGEPVGLITAVVGAIAILLVHRALPLPRSPRGPESQMSWSDIGKVARERELRSRNRAQADAIACAKEVDPVRAADSPSARQPGVDSGFANRLEENTGRSPLAEVLESSGLFHRRSNLARFVHGESDYAGFGVLRGDAPGGLDAAHSGHGDVHRDHIRGEETRELDGAIPVVRLSDDFEVRLSVEKAGEPPRTSSLMVREQDPDPFGRGRFPPSVGNQELPGRGPARNRDSRRPRPEEE